MGRSTRDEWREHVARWRASGLTAETYATKAGLKPPTFKWWRWQLSKERARSAAMARRPKSAPTTSTPITFVEIATSLVREPLEVVLPSRHRVRVPDAFDAATLDRLLDVLERRG